MLKGRTYRYFKGEPLYPFGFGLSYSTFAYSGLSAKRTATGAEIHATVKNTSLREGAEVVQLYIHDGHSKIDRPVHELKGFQRVDLQPGETKTVEFALDRAALSYWSPETKDWTADPGTFEIQIGASSRDIRLRAPLDLKP